MSEPAVLLFDGVCNLCTAWVRFVVRRDPPPARFRFASLQSEAARRVLAAHDRPAPAAQEAPESLVLIEGGRLYERSTAALRVLRGLGLPWSLLYVLIVVPRALRDGVYRWIARRRYAWFGRREECLVPTPELRGRFLE